MNFEFFVYVCVISLCLLAAFLIDRLRKAVKQCDLAERNGRHYENECSRLKLKSESVRCRLYGAQFKDANQRADEGQLYYIYVNVKTDHVGNTVVSPVSPEKRKIFRKLVVDFSGNEYLGAPTWNYVKDLPGTIVMLGETYTLTESDEFLI